MAAERRKSQKTEKHSVKSRTKAHAPRKRKPFDEEDRWRAFAWLIPVALIVVSGVSMLGSGSAHLRVGVTSARLANLFQQARERAPGERIAFWSENLMRSPELLAPLGRGPRVDDTAPLFPKHYDCTTFVETVSALSRSRSGEDLADRIVDIRYRGGKASYETRNHFPEADWIPNNEAAGHLKDITLQTARKSGFMAAFAYKEIDKVAWFKSQNAPKRALAAQGKAAPVSVKVAYLPIENMPEALRHIPQGAVLNVVRQSRERRPVLITHQGFLIWRNGIAFFRHASRKRQITEVPFEEYARSLKGASWKVLGFNINAFSS